MLRDDMLELVVTVSLLSSLILYALTGGADFGGGMWNLMAAGPRADRQRKAIAAAIAPIWEANHVWLILIVVVLFTGFPMAFAAMMTALNIPVTLMLIGIVLRGSAFIFGDYKSQSADAQRRWAVTFGTASVVTPFLQGVIMGALATGEIHVVNGQVTTGFFAGWLTFFAVSCGVFALGLFAFLAATYLTLDAKEQPDLQNDFRLRAIWSALALWPMAGGVFLAARQGAPALFGGLVSWWAAPLLGATCLIAVGALLALWRRRFAMARVAAAGQVTLILVGWSLAQYPNLITPDVTVAGTHAPEATLHLLIMALAIGALILFPSLVFLFRIFKGNRRR